jgi:hypothetical protein
MKNKQSFYKCKNCGDEIGVNTNSRLGCCKCGKLGVDGNGDYVRVIDEKNNSRLIEK